MKWEDFYLEYKQWIDQSAHVFAAFGVMALLSLFYGPGVSYLIVMASAGCRELFQYFVQGHKLGKGSAMDMAMFSNGALAWWVM